ncbi:MAG: CDP-alcohol phosphatidyltransferase family protein [Acidobacteria bacterium]|nr:CDP-alcohol phosphatidyltransferase family protein [Acidobacteriota bacterium]
MVRRLYAAHVTANQVTVTAWVVSVAIGAALIFAPRIWFLAIPVWMLLRMALNAVDGMLAREFGQKSSLGAFLNELSDVVSDAALYLPFAFVEPFDWRPVCAAIFASALSEMTGTVAVMAGASRRYDGPMGKSDRAFVFSLLAIWIACTPSLPSWADGIVWATATLAALTSVNRVRNGLKELREKAGTAGSEV